jgi:Transposase DDE domain
MTVACSMASFGSSVQVRHGATCQRPMVPAPLATIASFVGGGLACGTRSWMRWSPVDAAVQMIDTSVVRVRQHGACIANNNHQDKGRSRGGLTSKIHAVVDTNGLPVHLALTPGEAHDNRLCSVLLSALLPQTILLADRGYDADWIREFARQCRDPVRQTRSQLSGVHQARINPNLAAR